MADAVLGTLALGLAALVLWLVARTSDAVARLERKVDLLLRHSGVDLPAAAAAAAAALAREGQTIPAIKLYRELTGCGLAEAKARVEGLARPG